MLQKPSRRMKLGFKHRLITVTPGFPLRWEQDHAKQTLEKQLGLLESSKYIYSLRSGEENLTCEPEVPNRKQGPLSGAGWKKKTQKTKEKKITC